MANITQLKDNNQNQVFPVTKERAVYNEDGKPAINKPIATNTVTFQPLETAAWRTVYIPISLSEGYYTVRVTGVLDHTTTQTQSRVQSARNFNLPDTIKLLFSGQCIKSSEYTYSFHVSSYEAYYATYLVYTQQTELGGTVTLELYNSDQLHWQVDTLNNMIYKPLAYGSTFRHPLDSDEATWRNCYVPVNLNPGQYVVKTHVGSQTTNDVLVRFTKNNSLGVVDVVKDIFKRGTIGRDKVFYVDVTPDEAAIIQYLVIAQCITGHIDTNIEIFPVDQLYWDVDKLKNGIGTNLPSYYYNNDWLQNRLTLVNNRSSFIHGISFPFITDLHFQANSLNSKYLLKEILDHTACSMVVCGGDIAPAYGDEDDLQYVYDTLLEYTGYIGHDKWFSVVGNHDFHINESAANPVRTNWTWGKTYNGLIKPSERWQVRSEMTGGYYCIDNDVQKTRFVMLNTTEPVSGTSSAEAPGYLNFTDAQLSWLISVLLEHSNYHIIVISHITTDPVIILESNPQGAFARVQSCLEAFRNKTTYSDSDSGITADFTNTTNELVCHISGHCHSDESNVSNNLLSITTTCDAHYRDDAWDATIETVSEQALDVYCIDYDARTIRTVRFGRGENRSWTY